MIDDYDKYSLQVYTPPSKSVRKIIDNQIIDSILEESISDLENVKTKRSREVIKILQKLLESLWNL